MLAEVPQDWLQEPSRAFRLIDQWTTPERGLDLPEIGYLEVWQYQGQMTAHWEAVRGGLVVARGKAISIQDAMRDADRVAHKCRQKEGS